MLFTVNRLLLPGLPLFAVRTQGGVLSTAFSYIRGIGCVLGPFGVPRHLIPAAFPLSLQFDVVALGFLFKVLSASTQLSRIVCRSFYSSLTGIAHSPNLSQPK